MTTHVAFLRAINVGGRAVVTMRDLCAAFAAAGCQNVRTFIASGNVIFDSPDEAGPVVFERIRSTVRALLGTEPGILFRSARELETAAQNAPFEGLTGDRLVKLYVVFLSEKPRQRPRFPITLAKEALEALSMKNNEVFVVSRRKPNGFYGFPNNFIEGELGVRATTRNISTVTKIVEMLRQTASDETRAPRKKRAG